MASVRSSIQQLVKNYHLSNAKISIAVRNANNGNLLYTYKPDREMTPASNNKLFTAAAALFVLPKNFQFTTNIWYDPSQLKNHTLYGDLYMHFSGDPTFSGNTLSKLLDAVPDSGIEHIAGNVIVQANTFSGPYIPKGWSATDQSHCYGAPVSTLNMNRNCTVFNLVSDSDGKNTHVESLGNTSNIPVKNEATITNRTTASRSPLMVTMNDRNQVTITGHTAQKENYLAIPIKNPALKTIDTIRDFLKQKGVSLSGQVTTGNIPHNDQLEKITEHRSQKLVNLLSHMLKKSDNFYAESFMRLVGYTVDGVGSISQGTQAIQKVLHEKLGLNTDDLFMADGSGLSKLDHVSTAFMTQFLSDVYQNPQIGKRFYNALASSGINGTIAYRMNQDLLNKVHAKTGTLSGVSTLSGYLTTSNNAPLTFSIMLNDLTSSQRNSARRFQDSAVKVFYWHY